MKPMNTTKTLFKIVTPNKTVTVEISPYRMADVVDVLVKLDIECVVYNEDETVFYDSNKIEEDTEEE